MRKKFRTQELTEKIRQYFSDQFEHNLPATSSHFCTKFSIQMTPAKFGKYVSLLKEEFLKDPQKALWFNSVRLNKDTTPPNDRIIYFPKTIPKSLLSVQVRQYLSYQSERNLPATFYHFIKIFGITIPAKQFADNAKSWKISYNSDIKRIKWFDEVRNNKERLSRKEREDYFILSDTEQVKLYIEDQCDQNIPATAADFRRKYVAKLSDDIFYQRVSEWKQSNQNDLRKMNWYKNVRLNKEYAPPEERGLYFPEIFSTDTGTEEVRQYLRDQCKNKLPATWPHFAAMHPNTRVTQPEFNNEVVRWGKKVAEDPEKKRWFDQIRQSKEGFTHEQKKLYYPSKHHKDSRLGLVRQYLDDRCAKGDPATWDGYQADHPDTQITHEQYKDANRSWRKKYKDDAAKMDWFKNVRLNPESLPAEIKEKFFPQNMSSPDDIRTVVDFVEECYKGGRPASLASFHAKYDKIPDYTYKNGEREWNRQHQGDPQAMTWFREVRTQEARFAAQVGKWFDKAVNADLYVAFRDRHIPYYHQTTGFAALGVHPREPRRKEDYRVEGRILAKDLLAPGSGIGPALRKFLEDTKRAELMIDVTLSGYIGKKVTKYVDNSSCLLMINPGGMGGQRLLEAYARVLSMAEFTGKDWFNLQPEMAKSLNDDLYLARGALWGGPTSQAYKDWCAHADKKWERIKPELQGHAAQDQYEKRIHGEIVRSLRQGTMPRELEVYIQNARDAGHPNYADRLDLMARAMAALGAELRRKNLSKDVKADRVHIELVPSPIAGGIPAPSERIIGQEKSKDDPKINKLEKLSSQKLAEREVLEISENKIVLKEGDNFHASVRKVVEAAARVREVCREFSEIPPNLPDNGTNRDIKRHNVHPDRLKQEGREVVIAEKSAGNLLVKESGRQIELAWQQAKSVQEWQEKLRVERAREIAEPNALRDTVKERNESSESQRWDAPRGGRFRG